LLFFKKVEIPSSAVVHFSIWFQSLSSCSFKFNLKITLIIYKYESWYSSRWEFILSLKFFIASPILADKLENLMRMLNFVVLERFLTTHHSF
jgi:hypothetical protein